MERRIDRIETARLVLLPSSDDRDLALYKSHLTDPDEFFMQFGVRMTEGILDCVDFHTCNVVYYTAFLKSTGEMVGYAGIQPYEGSDGVGELEFHFFREHRGNGYCTEASAALMEAFFRGSLTGTPAKKVIAETMPKNTASIRVLEKLGFERTSVGMVISFGYEDDSDSVDGYSLETYEYVPLSCEAVFEADAVPAQADLLMAS